MTNNFNAGDIFDFGIVVFSEKDIIDFARKNDPLDFHTDIEKAKKHMFKGIVASGQHAFHHFYVNHWIPKFEESVVCGISVNNWCFYKPIYADSSIHCLLQVIEIIHHIEKNTATITWRFNFANSEEVNFQQLEMTVLHKTQ